MNVHSPAMQAELAHYNASMERSLEDKLFFLEHTAGAMTFVDFGCANGAVLKAISEKRHDKTLIGIDINQFQLNLAGAKVPNGVFAQDFEMVRDVVAKAPGPKVAIFSSVLHEAPNLLTAADANIFDYIVIRDMAITGGFGQAKTPEQWLVAVCKHGEEAKEAWDNQGKSIGSMAGLTEFLLKYPYLGHSPTQTERELSERYPMEHLEDLLQGTATDYAAILFEHYSAPWIVERIRQDFGFEFPFPTHFKMILKKVTL